MNRSQRNKYLKYKRRVKAYRNQISYLQDQLLGIVLQEAKISICGLLTKIEEVLDIEPSKQIINADKITEIKTIH